MNENHKDLFGIALTLSIVLISIYIVHRFIPSMLWAAVIVVATYPLYQRWMRIFGKHLNVGAFSFTAVLACLFLLPLSWLVSVLVQEMQYFINYLQVLNKEGGQTPAFFYQIPWISDELVSFWKENFAEPGSMRNLLLYLNINLTPASYYVKEIGFNIAHRGFQVGFTLLTLFFFFRDSETMLKQIQLVGEYCLGSRWFRYASKLPSALRGTVNGTIFVGLGVGVLMGICYALVGLATPALTGFLTAFAAMIPFLVPVVFVIVAGILIFSGKMIGAIIVLIWGTAVMFVADHFVKPVLIGGAISLPFLAVLFGILGGLETMGLLGLFLGPIVMVLFITLWQEPEYLLSQE